MDYLKLVRERLDWARQRTKEFIAAEADFLAAEPYQVIQKIDRQEEESCIRYILQVNKESYSNSRELSFRAGDAIHNLRASIDNLVYALAVVSNAPKELSLNFFESHEKFASKYAGQISRLPTEIQNWISNQQPYNRQMVQAFFTPLIKFGTSTNIGRPTFLPVRCLSVLVQLLGPHPPHVSRLLRRAVSTMAM